MKIKFVALSLVLGLFSLQAQEVAINKGVIWLNESQSPGGSWTSNLTTPFEATGIVADTLNYLGTRNIAYSNAINWIEKEQIFSSRYLSQKIKVLADYGSDTTELVGTLTASQNEDGGFGIALGYESDCLDTILALSALKSANYSDTTVIESALWYLTSNQNDDGGFGLQESNVYLTGLALFTLNQYRKDYYLEEAINKASNWLILQTPETLWEKALMYQAIMKQDLLDYILNNQQSNGSWDNDPFTTALCLRAIKDAASDLTIQDILFDPQVPLEGETTTITAIIKNIGGSISGTTTIRFSPIPNPQSLTLIPPSATSTITIIATFTSGIHKIIVEIEPIINERDKTNNSLTKNLTVKTLPDLFPHISFSLEEGTSATIILTVYNGGEADANGIILSFYKKSIHIRDISLNLEGGKNQSFYFIYPLSSGTNTFSCIVDPENIIKESNESNNSSTITIGGKIKPRIPEELTAIPGDTIVDLLWKREENISYNLYRSNGGGKVRIQKLIRGNFFRDTNLTNGIEYTYWVSAVDENGLESELSIPAKAIPDSFYVNPPLITQPTIYGETYWTNNPIITAKGDASPSITIKGFLDGILFDITTSDQNGSFSFSSTSIFEGTNTVTSIAIKNGNESKPSLPIIVILDITPPSAPTGLIATPEDSAVWLRWDANPEPDVLVAILGEVIKAILSSLPGK
ncbi:MAG: CARDB domain-containing protein [bacterium]